jgi:hypothetical protein
VRRRDDHFRHFETRGAAGDWECGGVEGEARSAQQAADVILKSNEATQIRRTWLGFVEGANGSLPTGRQASAGKVASG